MAITEESRHALYKALEDMIGHDNATTFMEHLPPVGWADVATKRDLDALEERLAQRLEISQLRLRNELLGEIHGLRDGLATSQRTLLLAVIGAMATLTAATAGVLAGF